VWTLLATVMLVGGTIFCVVALVVVSLFTKPPEPSQLAQFSD
jgi:hypothetical protein